MAPRKPKLDADDVASDVSSFPGSPLKPKAAKVTKPKAEKVTKPKADKVKVEKVKKAFAEGEVPVVKTKKEVVKKEPAVKKDAGGKEKVATLIGEEAASLIKMYLKETNRPYSATEVSANLHGKVCFHFLSPLLCSGVNADWTEQVTKTVADKVLKELAESGQLMSKATKGNEKGSQWVFWAIQDAADNASPAELAAMDSEISTLKEALPALKGNMKVVAKKLEVLKSAPTTKELVAKVEAMGREAMEKGERLKAFREGSVQMVTKEVLDRVEKEFKYWGARKGARRRAFDALEAMITEGVPKDELWDQAGLEEVDE